MEESGFVGYTVTLEIYPGIKCIEILNDLSCPFISRKEAHSEQVLAIMVGYSIDGCEMRC